jgi:uncharacterized protein
MDDELLEEYTKQVISVHGQDAEIEFAWHGGEPTLAGRGFFEKALTFQEKYGKGRTVRNSLQTNATILDEELCRLFRNHGFLLGVSVDGPDDLHNRFRGNTFSEVMKGIELLHKHRVSFNTLTAVHAGNWREPERVYNFLRELTDHMQFLPVIELLPAQYEVERGMRLAQPPGVYSRRGGQSAAEFSLTPEGFGVFLCGVLDVWKRKDRGKKFVQMFETTLGAILGKKGGLCTHDAICGHCACVLNNGDVYCCDRYCYENYRLGNMRTEPLEKFLEKNREFGMYKTYGLTDICYDCEYVKLCFGGCPKDRIRAAAGGDGYNNYICESYRHFFATVTGLIRNKEIPLP